VSEYVVHYHRERNHQGVGNRLLTPAEQAVRPANTNEPGSSAANGLAGSSTSTTGAPRESAIHFWHTTGARNRRNRRLPNTTEDHGSEE
jgi:hypothetical protein